MNKKLTKKDVDLIKKLYLDENKTQKEIIEILEQEYEIIISNGSLRNFIQKHNINKINLDKRKFKVSDEILSIIKRMYVDEQQTKKYIIDVLNNTYSLKIGSETLNKILNENNLTNKKKIRNENISYTDEDIKLIKKLYLEEDKTSKEICEIFKNLYKIDISEGNIQYIIRKYKFTKPSKKINITEEELELIRELFEDKKHTKEEIVEILNSKHNINLSFSSLNYLLRKNGFTKLDKPLEPYVHLTEEEKRQILELHSQNKRSKEIADELNIDNYKKVNAFLHREGLNCSNSIYFKINEKEVNDICNMYQDYFTAIEILEKYKDKITCENTIIKILKDNNIEIRPRGVTNPIKHEDFFEIIDTEEKAYILGFLIADGYIIKDKRGRSPVWGIELQREDKYILEKFNEIIGANRNVIDFERDRTNSPTHKVDKTYSSRLLIPSSKMVNDLKKYGIIQQKCHIIKFPTNIDEKFTSHLIRGIFDGDGCISGKAVSFAGNEYILGSIRNILVDKINLNNVKLQKPEDHCCSFIFSSKQNVKDFYNYIYTDATIYLTRKKERFEQLDYITPIN